jgi:hypothetical protein
MTQRDEGHNYRDSKIRLESTSASRSMRQSLIWL